MYCRRTIVDWRFPVIVELSRMASLLDFAVTQLAQPDLSSVGMSEQTYILVATHGQYDEDALEQALRSPARYIGMVEAAAERRHAAITRGLQVSPSNR